MSDIKNISMTAVINGNPVTIKPKAPSGALKNELREILKNEPQRPGAKEYQKKIVTGTLRYRSEIQAARITDEKDIGVFVAMKLLDEGVVTEDEILGRIGSGRDYDFEQEQDNHMLCMFRAIADPAEHIELFNSGLSEGFYQSLDPVEVKSFVNSFRQYIGV